NKNVQPCSFVLRPLLRLHCTIPQHLVYTGEFFRPAMVYWHAFCNTQARPRRGLAMATPAVVVSSVSVCQIIQKELLYAVTPTYAVREIIMPSTRAGTRSRMATLWLSFAPRQRPWPSPGVGAHVRHLQCPGIERRGG